MSTILLVDDTPESLRVLVRILTDRGYQVRAASSGERALATVKKELPDLILLDIQMPGMSGYEVCHQLQADAGTRSIPVIFVSSMDETLDKVKAFRIGAVDYITKPFQEAEVVARIETQLTILRQRSELLESRNLLSSVLECSLDGVAVYQAVRDGQGGIEDFRWRLINPAAATMFGHPAETLVGQQLSQWFPVVRSTGIFDDYVRVVETGQSLDKEILVEERWIHLAAVKLEDGVSVTFRDTTERKAMELALARQANRDGLTDLANRRAFDEGLAREWKRCARSHQPLALIMCDVDHFKKYNDSQGHLEGDDCLVRVARALQAVIKRPGDMVARYGGEEFTVILSETPGEGANTVAEAILAEVRRAALPHPASPFGVVTLSLGVAVAEPHQVGADGYSALLAAADRALYQAKEGGRNQVIQAELAPLARS